MFNIFKRTVSEFVTDIINDIKNRPLGWVRRGDFFSNRNFNDINIEITFIAFLPIDVTINGVKQTLTSYERGIIEKQLKHLYYNVLMHTTKKEVDDYLLSINVVDEPGYNSFNTTRNYCTSGVEKKIIEQSENDSDFITSAIIGGLTDNFIVGGLIGGSFEGGILGDLLNDNSIF